MGPLRIRVLSLESKLTPHARPVVDRKDATFGKVPNRIFFPLPFFSLSFFFLSFFSSLPYYLLVYGAYLVAEAAVYPEGYCFGPSQSLGSISQRSTTMLIFYAVLSLKAKES